MSTDSVLEGLIECIRASARHPLPSVLRRDHSFVLDLGFDSMSIARLALEVEDRFQQTILFDEWIAQEADPASLTIDSLCRYVAGAREDHEQAAV
jgi:acyl carrier protein